MQSGAADTGITLVLPIFNPSLCLQCNTMPCSVVLVCILYNIRADKQFQIKSHLTDTYLMKGEIFQRRELDFVLCSFATG